MRFAIYDLRFTIWSLLALAGTALVAQVQPPVIDSLSPASGPSSGGTLVTISGRNFDAKIQCILPCPTTVSFGGIPAAAVLESADTRIVVKTPPHVPGTIPVVVQRADGLTATSSFTYNSSIRDLYQQVLLPIFVEKTPGRNGSLWETTLVLHNAGSRTAYIAHAPCPPPQACPAIYPLTLALAPGETKIDPNLGPRRLEEPPGRLIYISRAEAPEVFASLRVRELSQEANTYGTEIEVVRENELRSTAVTLLDVPLDNRFRRALRIYEVGATKPVDFEVKVTSITGTEILLQVRLTTTTAMTDPLLPEEPAYVQILDFLEAPDLVGLDRAWVQITPLNPEAKFWAFIAVTNNATQQVTTITPQ